MAVENVSSRLNERLVFLFRIIFTTCLFGTIVFIFSNSSQIGALSGDKSAAVTEFLNHILSKFGFGFQLSEHLVRKLAHFSEYMLLGFWLMLTLRIYTRRIVSFVAWPLFLGLLTAVTDEFYQLFIPDRAGQVQDVVIDFAGVVSGLFVGLFALLLASALWDAFHGRR